MREASVPSGDTPQACLCSSDLQHSVLHPQSSGKEAEQGREGWGAMLGAAASQGCEDCAGYRTGVLQGARSKTRRWTNWPAPRPNLCCKTSQTKRLNKKATASRSGHVRPSKAFLLLGKNKARAGLAHPVSITIVTPLHRCGCFYAQDIEVLGREGSGRSFRRPRILQESSRRSAWMAAYLCRGRLEF